MSDIEKLVSGKRFLVVDDYEQMRRVTQQSLRTLGVETVLQAQNGSEALQLLNSRPVDMILSDWNMPVMDGLEFLKRVRADDSLKSIPLIMITSEVERHRVKEAIENGVTSVIVKPYSIAILADHIEKGFAWRARRTAPPAPQIAAAESPRPRGAESPAAKTEKPTILVVDDTPDNLQLLAGLFKDEFRVKLAHNGERALAICQADNPPDLVLLDVMMPGMDGFEVAQKMREHPNSDAIPIIFVTAMTGDEARNKGLHLGAVDFVTKPIDPVMLVPKVRNFLRYVELHKQLQSDFDSMVEVANLRDDVEYITRHDVKAPLAAVIGLIQSLVEDGSLPAKHLEQLKMAEETALQALHMISRSSELYKIETGRFQLNAQPVKIEEILRKIVEISQNTFRAKHLKVSLQTEGASSGPASPQVSGDAMLCYSIFQNLIKNACEAAPDASQVVVSIKLADPLQIVVRNQGVVPREIRNTFFEKFVTHGKSGGTGLGTYSAKLLAEAQRGSISLATSDETGSTTVTVSLPRCA